MIFSFLYKNFRMTKILFFMQRKLKKQIFAPNVLIWTGIGQIRWSYQFLCLCFHTLSIEIELQYPEKVTIMWLILVFLFICFFLHRYVPCLLLALIYLEEVMYYHIAWITNLFISTHIWPVYPFYTPWKHQQTKRLLVLSGGIKWEQWLKMAC